MTPAVTVTSGDIQQPGITGGAGTQAGVVTTATPEADQRGWGPASSQLAALARNAHRTLTAIPDSRARSAEYWHVLGQRNAYAFAAGLVLSHGRDVDAFALSEGLIEALENGVTEIQPLQTAADAHAARVGTTVTPTSVGPASFTARYGAIPGTDHVYGSTWGPRGDQILIMRLRPGGDVGLLYGFDPTWAEFTALAEAVHLRSVGTAYRDAVAHNPRMPVTDFAAAVARLEKDLAPNRPATLALAEAVVAPTPRATSMVTSRGVEL